MFYALWTDFTDTLIPKVGDDLLLTKVNWRKRKKVSEVKLVFTTIPNYGPFGFSAVPRPNATVPHRGDISHYRQKIKMLSSRGEMRRRLCHLGLLLLMAISNGIHKVQSLQRLRLQFKQFGVKLLFGICGLQ